MPLEPRLIEKGGTHQMVGPAWGWVSRRGDSVLVPKVLQVVEHQAGGQQYRDPQYH